MERPESCDPIWVAFGLDPIHQKCLVMGWTPTAEEALKDAGNYPDLGYVRAFQLIPNPDFPRQFYDWLLRCGVTTDDADGIVRQYGNELWKFIEANDPLASNKNPTKTTTLPTSRNLVG